MDEELNAERLSDLYKVTRALVTGAGRGPSAGHAPRPGLEPWLHPSKLWGLKDVP